MRAAPLRTALARNGELRAWSAGDGWRVGGRCTRAPVHCAGPADPHAHDRLVLPDDLLQPDDRITDTVACIAQLNMSTRCCTRERRTLRTGCPIWVHRPERPGATQWGAAVHGCWLVELHALVLPCARPPRSMYGLECTRSHMWMPSDGLQVHSVETAHQIRMTWRRTRLLLPKLRHTTPEGTHGFAFGVG